MTGAYNTSRRQILKLTGVAAAAFTFPAGLGSALAADKRHGLSVFGELKYPADFSHFDYINPDAPKGGAIAFSAPSWGFNQNPQTYNTFNTFILKGDAPPRMELCFDSLMVRALDEPDALYGLVAERVEIMDDGNTYIFYLRPEARFHDGSKLTAEDVAFSLILLKAEGHPQISQILTELKDVEVLDSQRVAVQFSGKQTRQLPLSVAELPIFSKRYYSTYDFKQSTLTPPLSSGPYKVGKHAVGRYVEYKRVSDYWAKDLPVSRGHNNFDVVRVEFFRERVASFEAFKKGVTTFHEESVAKTWATEYNFPAIEDGRVTRREFPDNRPAGAQGWFMNTRRAKLADPRVRRAIGYALDFEWSNKALFFGLYTRTQSFFQNSPMMASGLPDKAELALLEPYRGKVPEEVFGEAILAPVSDGSGSDRMLFREAAKLLEEAGFTRDGASLLTPDGQPFTLEIIEYSPGLARVTQPFVKNLQRLGIQAALRVVDPAQFQARLNDFDFDICSRRYSLTATFSDGLRELWDSKAASLPGSANLSGIQDPVVDTLIDKSLAAATREDMNTAVRALDRVLRSGYYWVPGWNKPLHTVAFWDMFGYPEKPPFYDFPVETTWWVDQAKAEKIGKAG